ncbi:Uncharacterized membrane protein [Parafrankia irregularis]|uniref:Uncharacterized membrane protein n=1 Tax=Parafrankia irregularis TaxID=795642 RepID=A0A0S4QH44_9ACTN|nr:MULTISPECIES: anthrone oxygenase family protein [Parafrankia]MBE3203309.1 DUF1772 domain-containing protein [Parafrankia sp. CH37]CUU54044.1 Uncharacterized membrane protein [Parafrankia irregularis]
MSEAALIAAVVTTGLMSGIFLGFSTAVMPALARVDDRAFVDVMRAVNAAIQNGVFALVLLGALASSGVATWRYAGHDDVLPWVVAGLAGYLVTLAITFRANIPLNNRLDRTGPAEDEDVQDLRAGFERSWVRWHHVRTLSCLLAFGCLCAALLTAA